MFGQLVKSKFATVVILSLAKEIEGVGVGAFADVGKGVVFGEELFKLRGELLGVELAGGGAGVKSQALDA